MTSKGQHEKRAGTDRDGMLSTSKITGIAKTWGASSYSTLRITVFVRVYDNSDSNMNHNSK